MSKPTPTNAALEWRELVWTDTITAEQAAATLERLATAPELGTLVFELRVTQQGARWLLGTSPHRVPALTDALTAQLPVRFLTPRRVRTKMTTAAHIAVAGRHPLSTTPNRVAAAIRSLYGTVARLQDDERITLQLILGRRLSSGFWRQASSPSWLELLLAAPARTAPPARTGGDHDVHGFHCHIRLGASGSNARAGFLLRQIYGSLRTVESSEAKLHIRAESPAKLNEARLPWRWTLQLRSSELPVFTGWPIGEPPLPLIGSTHPRILPPINPLVRSERVIGLTAAPGHEEKVAIPIQDAAFHTHILGPTGSSKSTLMQHLILADVEAGRGVLVLDPKGDLATDVLARIPARRHQDVVVIDPTNASPVGFNPLAGPASQASVTADTLLSIFEALFRENWGIRTADVLSASFLDFARLPGANLLWLSPLLTDPAFRRRVLRDINDPIGTESFWRQYDAKKPDAQATEIAPVLNKLRQLILRPGLRAMLGQSEPKFDLSDLFTKKRIVIVNLNRGRLGADAAKLLGTLLLGQLWACLLARQALPSEQRHIVGIYIDEVHDFLAGLPSDLSDALAQARSLGGAFTLAHQYLAQLTPTMREAIDANTRNKIVYGLCGKDASSLAKQTPGLEAQDFMLLPRFHAYANVLQNGESSGWITIATRPQPAATGDAATLYAASHQRYGVPAEETERYILSLITPTAPDEPEDDAPIGRTKR